MKEFVVRGEEAGEEGVNSQFPHTRPNQTEVGQLTWKRLGAKSSKLMKTVET